MTPEQLKKYRRWAALIGGCLALACYLVPRDYRAICDVLVTLCGGH